jgi:hexosaminidase
MFSTSVFAQENKIFDENDLRISWRLMTNHFDNQDKSQAILSISNQGKEVFPSTGWTIFFSYGRGILPDQTNGTFLVSHLNGDIYQCRTTGRIKDVNPGDSLWLSFVSYGQILNYTSAPGGFYIVWDNQPDKGYSIRNYTAQPIRDTTVGFVTPADTYRKNQIVNDIRPENLPLVFPTALSENRASGEFLLDADVQIVTDPLFSNEAGFLSETIGTILGKPLKIRTDSVTGKTIFLKKVVLPEEAYQLAVQPDQIVISASSGAGIFYGIQSLRSAMPLASGDKKSKQIRIPALKIDDAPRFVHRGFMLDIARNFQPKAELLKVIDLMAMYKLNRLHLHFSDDEGWRIQIPSLPELTEVGGRRGFTTDSHAFLPSSYCAGPEPGQNTASGFYTRADFIEILKYATERYIQIIPEIESPGHSRAAIKAMDKRYRHFMELGDKTEAERYLLRDLNDQSIHSSAQQWTDNVMCVALPSTYRFLETVIDALVAIYREAQASFTTIHLGGDEVPEGTWEKSPLCNQLIAENPELHSTDDLWYYYFNKMDEMLKQRHLALAGWEEIAMRKTSLNGAKHFIPNPGFADRGFRANVWNNGIGWGSEDLPYRLANAGYQVVLSCVSHLYFDLAYEKSPDEPGLYWGGFNDLNKPFDFIPFDYYKNTTENTDGNPIDSSLFIGRDRLTDYGKSNILGIQGQLWAENIRSTATLEYLLFPKMLALAERAWAPDPRWAKENNHGKRLALYQEAWSVFVNTIGKKELPRLTAYPDGAVQYRIPPVGADILDGILIANIQIPGFDIRYTTDGTEPTTKSRIYTKPLTEKGNITLCAFSKDGRKGRTITLINP